MDEKNEKPVLKRKHLIPVLVVLLLALAVCVSATFSWFYYNKTVTQKDVVLESDSYVNLVISDSSTGVKNARIGTGKPYQVTTTFKAGSLMPCTRYNNNLCYLTNATVDPATGVATGGTYVKVPDSKKSYYYSQKTVYIADGQNERFGWKLQASISSIVATTGDTDSYLAGSVDFYTGTTYLGTLNLAGKNSVVNNGTSTKTTLDIILPNNTIPWNRMDSIPITMLFYYDGNLKKNATTLYINEESVNYGALSFAVRFKAVSVS